MGNAAMANVLELVDKWPVTHVAVAILDPSGRQGAHGPLDHSFDLASVTKPLTAYAVLVAVEEGTVELDEAAGPPGSTVRHLLAHASGLAPDEPVSLADPGERRIYSNSGFDAVADVVSAKAGMPFAQYLHEAVFAPLAMTSTVLKGSAAYGATSTVADLALFAGELLDPQLIDRSTLAEATSPQFAELGGVLPGFGRQEPNLWGLGFEIRGDKSPHWTGSRNSPATFGHFGRSGTFLWVDPVAQLACVCCTDRDFGEWAITAWPALADAVIELR